MFQINFFFKYCGTTSFVLITYRFYNDLYHKMLYVVDSLFLVHKMRRYLKYELDFKSNVFFYLKALQVLELLS